MIRDRDKISTELWNAQHFNSNRLVVVAIKTTGDDSKKHELASICIFPMNSNYTLSKEIIPFYCDIKPIKRPFGMELGKGLLTKEKYFEICETALMPQATAELFDRWMENKIRLIEGKKLIVLSYNWAAKKNFIKNWLGTTNFNSYFSHEYRDIMSTALFCNDYADVNCQQIPYAKIVLSYLAKVLRVPYDRRDETILHCKAMVEIYREMMRSIVPQYN